MFNRQVPDILLVDIRMEDMDDLIVLATVVEKSPYTPIIMLSGTGVIEDVVDALRKGAWNYLSKPIEDLDVLYFVIEQSLHKSSLMRHNESYRIRLESEVAQQARDLNSLVNNLPIGLFRISPQKSDELLRNL